MTDLPGTLAKNGWRGFRLRKNNIALGGPERVADLFAEKSAPTNRRFNAWYVGEIHVQVAPTPCRTRVGMASRTQAPGLGFETSWHHS